MGHLTTQNLRVPLDHWCMYIPFLLVVSTAPLSSLSSSLPSSSSLSSSSPSSSSLPLSPASSPSFSSHHRHRHHHHPHRRRHQHHDHHHQQKQQHHHIIDVVIIIICYTFQVSCWFCLHIWWPVLFDQQWNKHSGSTVHLCRTVPGYIDVHFCHLPENCCGKWQFTLS